MASIIALNVNDMTKAEEQALKAYPKMSRITEPEGTLIGDGNAEKREGFIEGYNQAEQDLMDKAKQWFTEHTNIPYKVETNEDGEPLADSYIQYAKARLDAANEMFEKFKQFITEN